MQLYNTLSRGVETFDTSKEPITVYVCGITPYDATHLGHAFTYATIDILIRYLQFRDHRVRYVQNVTDLDDDILRKADEIGENWRELGDRWTARYIREMIALNLHPPDHFPRATDLVPQIAHVVQRLVSADVAYESGGSVYFHIDAWPEYGKLSRLSRDEMLPIANERGNDPDDPNKRDPLDFVLWQAQAPGEPAWDSPWGAGRPGWHIECSTIAMHFLGNAIDLHSGGSDLIFPHHESEIAQAEGATGEEPFVRHWLHTAMVRHEGEKMSKSLGNLIMMRDLLEDWSPDALRLYMARHHYRDVWSHSRCEIEDADQLAHKLAAAVTVSGGSLEILDGQSELQRFIAAMDDDLDTPNGIAQMENLADTILDAADQGRQVYLAQETLRSMATVFGLRLDAEELESHVTEGWSAYLADFT